MNNHTDTRVFSIHTRLKGRISTLLCFLLSQFVFGAEAYAQTVVPLPTVTRAIDVFESSPERVIVGSRLAFKTKATTSAQKIVRSGLQVRVFTLRDDQSRPSPITIIDDCDVFLSVVLKVDSPSGTEAIIQTLDHHWLNLTDSLNSIIPGKYLFVFEQSGPDSEQFRLKQSDYKTYFDTGFLLTVDKHDGISLETVRSAYFERRDKLGRLRLEIDKKQPSVPCYTYRRLISETLVDTQISQSTMGYCEGELYVEAPM